MPNAKSRNLHPRISSSTGIDRSLSSYFWKHHLRLSLSVTISLFLHHLLSSNFLFHLIAPFFTLSSPKFLSLTFSSTLSPNPSISTPFLPTFSLLPFSFYPFLSSPLLSILLTPTPYFSLWGGLLTNNVQVLLSALQSLLIRLRLVRFCDTKTLAIFFLRHNLGKKKKRRRKNGRWL